MRIGSGSHVYEVEAGWGKTPDSIVYGYTHGIEVDREDNVYIFHTGNPSVVVLDRKGNLLAAWGAPFEGGAHGFLLHSEGGRQYLYMTDIRRGLVVKTTLDGEELLTIGRPDLPDLYGGDRKYIPTDIAVAPNGDIYIADGYGESWIHRYDARGRYLDCWGGKGTEPGKLLCPHGISLNLRGAEPELYVADRGNHRIQVFTLDGKPKRMMDDNLDRPCGFYFSGDEMYVPDLHSRVTVFDRHDRLITHLGEDQQAYKQEGWPNLPRSYYRPHKFSSPHAVCVDARQNVYVAEWVADGRLTKLTRVLDP